ncbi:MAG: glycosyltransferase [Halopseudomonas sp.]
MSKPIVVYSAVGLVEGGTLSVAKSVFTEAEKEESCRFIALVNDKRLYPRYRNVKLIEVPSAKKNWLCRLYFEFITSYRISQRLSPAVWFALHDITPRVKADRQFVYCHNPTPFYRAGIRDLIFQPTVFLFSMFYRYLYRLNIRANQAVFVQQSHIRDYFQQTFDINNVVVARPSAVGPAGAGVPTGHLEGLTKKRVRLFYPTLPRTFKNIELLIAAAKLLNRRGFDGFEIIITVSKHDSLYVRYLAFLAKNVEGIRFIGRLSHQQVMDEYRQSDALVFPSKLETWGLPLSEAKTLALPVLAAALPYAKETLGTYPSVNFFDPNDPADLADNIEALAAGKGFEGCDFQVPAGVPVVEGWGPLLRCICSSDQPADSAL